MLRTVQAVNAASGRGPQRC